MKYKCSEGICEKAKRTFYYCRRMDERGIFEIRDPHSGIPFLCPYTNKITYWIKYDFEYIMKEAIKKHEENKNV